MTRDEVLERLRALANARAVAATGVDYISLGAITHSAAALDLSLEVETE